MRVSKEKEKEDKTKETKVEEKKQLEQLKENESSLAKIEEKIRKVEADFTQVLEMQKDILLNKFISFDSMIMDDACQNDREMKKKLYQLFFKWKQDSEEQDMNEDAKILMTEEDRLEKDKVDLAEEKKLEKLAKE